MDNEDPSVQTGNSASNAIGNFFNDFTGTGGSSARAQNQANRDFQERMSNTAYQRGRADMEKAGINPMAMFAGGGNSASTPSGSSGSSGNGGNLVGVINSALKIAELALI